MPEESKFRYHRASEITPQQPLCDYVTNLTSDAFRWLTCLTISNIACARVDIINISKLHNVVAIDICGSDLTEASTDLVDDNVIRNWGRRAKGINGSFSLLRVLILRNQAGVTARSLEYLSAFPSLALYGVRGCRVTEHDATPGWTNEDEHDVFKMVQRDIEHSQTWDDPIRSCFLRSAALLSLERTAKPMSLPCFGDTTESIPQSLSDLPLLNFRLGHTSSDVLYSKPLIFFRCLRSEACCETSAVQNSEASNRLQQDCEKDKDRASKKRKVRVGKQIDLGEFFQEVALPLHTSVLLRDKVSSH